MLRGWHYCVLAGLLPMAARLAMLPLVPIPVPQVHDEFSYLLGADTFASGRVTNPPHPMWVHFETFHVNPLPTYCSKYPPAQAVFLALGQRFLGDPWFGVWLSMGLMFAAVCWMLQGWVSLPYAALATLLSILTWGLAGAWINSYWGGCVAATGGALLIGAIPRLLHKPGLNSVLAAAIGLVVLANSRPFEGLVTACAAAAVFGWQAHRKSQMLHPYLSGRFVAPFLLIMISGAAAMGYYNYRTTGNALVMPYAVNQRLYAAPPLFYVLPTPPKAAYRHENIRRFWDEWVRPLSLDSRARPYRAWTRSGIALAGFYLFSPFGLAILAGLFAGWGPKVRAVLAVLVPPIIGLMLINAALPHYLAPALGALPIIGACGLEKAGRRQAGRLLIALLIGMSAAWCGIGIKVEALQARKAPTGIATRPLLIDRLQRQAGQHLVIVRYRADHNFHDEWVYNRADIDAAKIVWAQDMGTARNRELLDYYQERKVWLLQPDADPLALSEYRESDGLTR
jgi:hypothetical protein